MASVKPCNDFTCEGCGVEVGACLSPITGNLVKKAQFCDACQERREQAERERAERERQSRATWRKDNIKKLLGDAGVPPRYQGHSLETFKGDLPFERPALISGPCGTGKTHLAVGYLREWILEHDRPGGATFVSVVDLLGQIRQSFNDKSGTDERVILERMKKTAKLLVLDDLGAEKLSDFVAQTFYDIVDWRYGYMRPTIITTNLTIDQVAASYGDRIVSRLSEMGGFFMTKGQDLRPKIAAARKKAAQRQAIDEAMKEKAQAGEVH